MRLAQSCTRDAAVMAAAGLRLHHKNDKDMVDPETGTASLARNTNLNEDLGKVEYVFSDKDRHPHRPTRCSLREGRHRRRGLWR